MKSKYLMLIYSSNCSLLWGGSFLFCNWVPGFVFVFWGRGCCFCWYFLCPLLLPQFLDFSNPSPYHTCWSMVVGWQCRPFFCRSICLCPPFLSKILSLRQLLCTLGCLLYLWGTTNSTSWFPAIGILFIFIILAEDGQGCVFSCRRLT